MLMTQFAPAKINLTLEILGRRPDGYHELRSLVAFAKDVGDRLELEPGHGPSTAVVGEFAAGIAGTNLVDKAVSIVLAAVPDLDLGQLTLEKLLPVASGLGGGSADAAAALRLIRDSFPQAASLDYLAIARQLGADVPVCLRSRAAVMTGIGERIEEIALPAGLCAVLANPLIEVPSNKTAQVFAHLAAPPLAENQRSEMPTEFSSAKDVISYASSRSNGLEAPARALFPVIGGVLMALAQLPECRLARLSGAGPTCFALFENEDAAAQGADSLHRHHPSWWIRWTRLS